MATSEGPIKTAAEFKKLDIEEPKLLLSPWLIEGSLTLIASHPGVGKTHFSLEIAEATASGRPAFNDLWPVAQSARTLYIDGEMHPYDIKSRFIEMEIDNLYFLSKLIYDDDQNVHLALNLLNPEIRSFITKQVQEYGFRLMVLDNL